MLINQMKYWALPLLVCIPMQSVQAAKPIYTWGKPGVSRTDYDKDAVYCAYRSAVRDVENDKEAVSYVQGFNALERENNMPPMARPPEEEGLVSQANRNVLLKRMYSPDRKVDALQKKLQSEVESCLIARGYTKILLSKKQSSILKKLKPGSMERKDVLYNIGTADNAVMSQVDETW